MPLTRLPLALRNLIFVLLQPGIVAGVIPYMIAKNSFKAALASAFVPRQGLGILVCLAGVIIVMHCVTRFATDGFGTLSPADPTRRLVTSGLYRWSRNPMYVGVMMILAGEAVFSGSVYLLLYAAGIFVLFHLFILYREEPRLRRDFGQSYETYCSKVRRWV